MAIVQIIPLALHTGERIKVLWIWAELAVQEMERGKLSEYLLFKTVDSQPRLSSFRAAYLQWIESVKIYYLLILDLHLKDFLTILLWCMSNTIVHFVKTDCEWLIWMMACQTARHLAVLRDEKLQSHRTEILRRRSPLRRTAVHQRLRHVFWRIIPVAIVYFAKVVLGNNFLTYVWFLMKKETD